MKLLKTSSVGLMLVLKALMVCAQQSYPLPRAEQMHLVVRFFEEERGFNGNVLVAQNDEIIYENAVGWANIETEEALNLNSLFYLASVSKTFTAASIMLLAQQGKLSYDQSISVYFEELGTKGSEITIRHLLNHTSGLPDYFKMSWDVPGLTNAQLYRKLVESDTLLAKPGHRYNYNNTGYVLLAIIVEKVSGLPYYQYFQENIAEPLDLHDTWVYDERNDRMNGTAVAIGYAEGLRRRDDYYLLTYGDGGMYSTLSDLFKWGRVIESGDLIDQDRLQEAFSTVLLPGGRVSNYGFGWEIGSNTNGKTISHTGGLAGFRIYIEKQLDVGTTIIILTNNSGDDVYNIRNLFVKIMDGRPYELPGVK